MANYIDGKEDDSTLNQRNDELLETPPKIATTLIRPSIELPTFGVHSQSPNSSVPNDISQAPHTSTPIVPRPKLSPNQIPSIVSIENRFPESSVHYFTIRDSNSVLPRPIRPVFNEPTICFATDGVLDLSKKTGRHFRSYDQSNQLHRNTEPALLKPSLNNQPIIHKYFQKNVELQPFRINDLSLHRSNLSDFDRVLDLSVSSTTQTLLYNEHVNVLTNPGLLISKTSQTSPSLLGCHCVEPTVLNIPFTDHRVSGLGLLQPTLSTFDTAGLDRELNKPEIIVKCSRKRNGEHLEAVDMQCPAKRNRTNIVQNVEADVETDEEIDIVTLDANDVPIPPTVSYTVAHDVHAHVPIAQPPALDTQCATETINNLATKPTPSPPEEEWKPSVYRHISIEPPKVQRQNLQVQFNNSPTTERVTDTQSASTSNDLHTIQTSAEKSTSLPTSLPRPNIGSITKSVAFLSPNPTTNVTGPIVKFDMSSLNHPGQQALVSDQSTTNEINHNFSWASLPTKVDRSYEGDNSCDEDCISIFAPSLR